MAVDYNGGKKIHYIVFSIYLIPSGRLVRQGLPPLGATRAPPTSRRSEWSSREEPNLKKQQPRAKGENECIPGNKRQQRAITGAQ